MTERKPFTVDDPGVWLGSQLEHPAESAGLTTPAGIATKGADNGRTEQGRGSALPAGSRDNRGNRGCADCRGGAMNNNGPRLVDIVILLLFAVLLRLVESLDRDTPGWWQEGAAHDWRLAVDADALERREGRE
jgi:hypothetical protein